MDESEVRKFEQEIKPMKMSEAIRIGCMIRPFQCRSVYAERDDASCALGAAAEGALGPSGYKNLDVYQIADIFSMPYWMVERVAHLNDAEKWSREMIIDWLEARGW